jgi:hypothetical protein
MTHCLPARFFDLLGTGADHFAMRKYAILLFTMILIAYGTERAAQTPVRESETYRPTATIKEIMVVMVDPSADYMWEAVATEVSAAGIRERLPKNDKEWAELRNRTLTLIEATNLLAIPGRHVAKAGEKSAKPQIELEPEQIETLINMDRTSWVNLTHGLHDASMQALAAVDAKDAPAFLRAGVAIDRACENCHLKFWYPGIGNNPPRRP